MPACLAIFDANCPENFAPNERNDYTKFLEDSPEGYEVCEVSHSVAAAFGLVAASDVGARLVWIMIDPRVQGHGLGRIIMQRITARSAAIGADRIHENLGFTGRGVTVAVIDSGITPTSAVPASRILANIDFTDAGDDPADHLGHGTHIAGTIGGLLWRANVKAEREAEASRP